MLTQAEYLRQHHLKVTPQRLAIFHALSQTNAHPSAETIYNSLRESHPTMSLATVYKTLDALVKNHLIQQLNVGEDSYRYDYTTVPHPHIICTCCKQVFDIAPDALPNLRAAVASVSDFEITHEQLYFYGTCPACKAAATH